MRDIPASEVARWLATMDDKLSPFEILSWQPNRAGKSVSWITEGAVTNQLSGKEAGTIVYDEWASVRDLWLSVLIPPVAVYKDERFPAATVEVHARKIDKRNPRNPNPAAGSHEQFVAIVGGREGKPTHLAMAKMQAEQIHKRLVAALQDEADRLAADKEAEEIALSSAGRF
ncbi:MAG: hypothetical protein DI537_14015 [Stutzerimonas stutzeri]|nr:MAG: hypothetical protein DI537_14015 [Stutzerimonas stutzeri]